MTRQPLESWFTEPGAYVLVDGQYGSTGKGLMAGYIADLFVRNGCCLFDYVTTNAGPNSGHTAYFHSEEKIYKGHGDYDIEQKDEKIVTQQIPIASVFAARYGCPVPTILNGGAVIDSDILEMEIAKYGVPTFIHPCAALITASDKANDQEAVRTIASTGKGVGPAMAAKLMRYSGATAKQKWMPDLPEHKSSWDNLWNWNTDRVFVETAQGFSLGVNSARFYPHTTSRECTVMQAISDARIPAQMVRKVIATYRTYPIRVGNTQGSSGDCYPDQEETTWEALGLEPEITTVTKRVRRVFTWSRTQFRESIAANRPDAIFLNFMNYLTPGQHPSVRNEFLHTVHDDYCSVMGEPPEDFLLGFGPKSSDVMSLEAALEGEVW